MFWGPEIYVESFSPHPVDAMLFFTNKTSCEFKPNMNAVEIKFDLRKTFIHLTVTAPEARFGGKNCFGLLFTLVLSSQIHAHNCAFEHLSLS